MCNGCVLVEIVPDDFDCGMPLATPTAPEPLASAGHHEHGLLTPIIEAIPMKFLAYGTPTDKHFARPDPAMEKFQPWPKEAGFELVETCYFGFNIPEEKLNCEIYHWVHPHLGVSTGGVFIFQGRKPLQIAADFADYRTFMPMPENIVDCTWPSGVRIDMLEPNQRFRVQFRDDERDTRFDFESIAIMPLAVRPDGHHFTQAMRTRGELVLRGREYRIDSFFTRDRSWGDKRSEKPMAVPPLSWAVGVFDETFAFHAAAFESPERHPDYALHYPFIKAGENHLWGYIWNEGRMSGIARVDNYVERAGDNGLAPDRMQMRVTDSDGRIYDIRGTVQAQMPFHTWDNMTGFLSQTRWECNGKVGYGDHQDCNFNDHSARVFNFKRIAGS
jgi:hypothetical protein